MGLDNSYAERATFTSGDSVDATLTDPAFLPVSLTAPDIRAMSRNKPNALDAAVLGDLCDCGYAEVQLHDGVPASAIRRVVYTRLGAPGDEAFAALEATRLVALVAEADDPGPSSTD